MTDIKQIPINELLDDRAASLADISICEWALLQGVTEYNNKSVQHRLDINKAIVAKIEQELWRRDNLDTTPQT